MAPSMPQTDWQGACSNFYDRPPGKRSGRFIGAYGDSPLASLLVPVAPAITRALRSLETICFGWLKFIECRHRRGVEQFGSSLGS